MDCQSTNLFEIWKDMGILTVNGVNKINHGLEELTMKLDSVYNNLIQVALKELSNNYGSETKKSKRQSKIKYEQTGNLFHTEPSFQQPAIPPLRRTKRQASILAVDKIKGVRESAAISSSGGYSTRASRARALSTFMDDLAPLNCPKANSTFVVDKKGKGNIDEFLSPQDMFSLENNTYIKPANANQTYDMPVQSKRNLRKNSDEKINLKTDDTSLKLNSSKESEAHKKSTRNNSKKNSMDSEVKNKQREKLEDIDVNIDKKSNESRASTKKRKLQEENQISEVYVKKTNVISVPLEKQISTPHKPLDELIQTPHQIRENEAEKRKEMYLRSRANNKKFDDQHLKVTKQREIQMKHNEEKLIKAAEDKRKKEEIQKQKEQIMKEEILKKQKKLAELNSKRKQALESKVLKHKVEIDQKVKEIELKKKYESKPEKCKPVASKVVKSQLPAVLPKPITKTGTLPKPKIGKNETNKNINDYGLNDMSARDSSEDESGPRKIVPNWAKRENRAPVLELQYHVDAQERDKFFNCPKIMDLQETFEGWPIRNRQRTSSAVWNTPTF